MNLFKDFFLQNYFFPMLIKIYFYENLNVKHSWYINFASIFLEGSGQ